MPIGVSTSDPHATITRIDRSSLTLTAMVAAVLLVFPLCPSAFAQSDQYSTSGARGGNIVSDADAWWHKHDDTFRRRSQQCRPLLAQAETFRLRAEDFRIEAKAPNTPSRERSRLQAEANNQQGQAGAVVRQFYDCSGRAQSDQIQTQGQQGQGQQPSETPRLPRFELNAQVETPRDPVAPPAYPGPRRVEGETSGGSASGGAAAGGPAREWAGTAEVPPIPGRYGKETVYITIRDMHLHSKEKRYRTFVDLTRDPNPHAEKKYARADGIVDREAKTFTITSLTPKDRPENVVRPPRAVVVSLR